MGDTYSLIMLSFNWDRIVFVKYGVKHTANTGSFFSYVGDVLTEGNLASDCNAQIFGLFGPVNSVIIDL